MMTETQQIIQALADAGLLAPKCFDRAGNVRIDANRKLAEILTRKPPCELCGDPDGGTGPKERNDYAS